MGKVILETERLLLREMEDEDFPALCRMLQDPQVMYAYEHAFSDEEAWAWLGRQQERYARDGIGLWAGCPTLVIPLALDQWYYGRTIHELGAGPAPLYIRKKLCTKEQLQAALTDLVSGKYDSRAKQLSTEIRQENGIEEAIRAIEEYAG